MFQLKYIKKEGEIMNLNNGNIKLKEILKNPVAKTYLSRELPKLINHPLIGFAGGYTLNKIIDMNKKEKIVSDAKINEIVKYLEKV